MRSTVAKIVATLVLMLIIGVSVMVSPLKNHGYELSGGWQIEAVAEKPSSSAVGFGGLSAYELCNRTVSAMQGGFPFAIQRPAHGDRTGCLDETNSIAKSLNFFVYLVLAGAIVYGVSKLRNEKGHDKATKS